MANPKNPDVFFVGIRNAEDFRRSLLESTKDALTFLQKYESFLKIRTQKNEAIDGLKKLVKEIVGQISELKKSLPESDINRKLGKQEVAIEREILGIAEKKEKSEVKLANKAGKIRIGPSRRSAKKPEVKEVDPHKAEMAKLEAELKDIESKLRSVE